MLGSTGRLYVVATPLGNLEDVTLRALRILRQVALVACEDTRRTARLLQAHGISATTTSYFEHNERWKGRHILDVLLAGRDVALVSDAGTPGISDPGYRLVVEAHAAGIAVIPIPGPSAAVAALSVSGLPTDRFLFVGFLPARGGARRKSLAELADRTETLVVYESPVRVVATLKDMVAAWGPRDAFLCREATKLHEEYLRGTLESLASTLAARDSLRGEVALVVCGASPGRGQTTGQPGESVEELFRGLVREGLTRRAAVKEVAQRLGLPAREVYRKVLSE